MTYIPPVPAGAESGELLNALRAAVLNLESPSAPTRLWSVRRINLPPAPAWPDTCVLISDLDVMAFSNGAAWIRADNGDAI